MSPMILLRHCERDHTLPAIARRRERLSGAVAMADELGAAVERGAIGEAVLAQHSKWCHTGGSWSAGRERAGAAAWAMDGFVPDRMLGADGRPALGHEAALASCRLRSEGR